jgi:hypothetical protein
MKCFTFLLTFSGIMFFHNLAVSEPQYFLFSNTTLERRFPPSIKWDSVNITNEVITYWYNLPSRKEIKILFDSTKKIVNFEDKKDRSKWAKNERNFFLKSIEDWMEKPYTCIQSMNPIDRQIYQLFPQLVNLAKKGDLYDLQWMLITNFWILHPGHANQSDSLSIWSQQQMEAYRASLPKEGMGALTKAPEKKDSIVVAKTNLSSPKQNSRAIATKQTNHDIWELDSMNMQFSSEN